MGGVNSKSAFKQSVFRLAKESNLPANAEDIWDMFWLQPNTPDDVFSLITLADIRHVRNNARENFIMLFDKVLDRLLALKLQPDIAKDQNATRQLLNCVRVLTRMIPIAYEQDEQGQSAETQLLWIERKDVHGNMRVPGEQLVAATLDLLFTSGFTVPQATIGEKAQVRYTIWENGIGQNSSTGSSADHVSRRLEVMRLLLVLITKTMYIPPAKLMVAKNLALSHIAYNSDQRLVLAILCSFTNIALKESPQGWGATYRNSPAANVLETLSMTSLQSLLVILSYEEQFSIKQQKQPETAELAPRTSPIADSTSTLASEVAKDGGNLQQTSSNSSNIMSDVTKGHQNLFRVFISKLHRTQDFEYLITNILRLLDETMKRNLSILNSIPLQSQRRDHVCELVMLLWCLMKYNGQLRAYIIDHNSTLKLFTILVYFMLENKDKPAQADMIRMITQVLHYILESPQFATRLAQSFEQSVLPATMRMPESNVNYGDFLVSAVYSLMVTTKNIPAPTCIMLLGIVRNSGPYLTQLSAHSSACLLRLFDVISSPAFLIGNPTHVQWLITIIEALDYIVHFRATDNPNLIYEMVKSRGVFQRLRDFNLDEARAALTSLKNNRPETHDQQLLPQQPSSLALPPMARGLIDYLVKGKVADKRLASPNKFMVGRATPQSTNTSNSGQFAQQNVLPRRPVFEPTQEWVLSWLPDLPIDPILRLLDTLAPHIQAITEKSEAEITARLSRLETSAQGSSASITVSSAAKGKSSSASNIDQQQYLASESGDNNSNASSVRVQAIRQETVRAVVDWLGSDDAAKCFPDLAKTQPTFRPRTLGDTPAMSTWYMSFLLGRIYSTDSNRFSIWKRSLCRLFVVKQG